MRWRSEPRGRARRRTALGAAGIVVVLLIGAAAAAGVTLGRGVLHPRVDTPANADAVVVLGPVQENDALALGIRLVDEGLAPTLVVSAPPGGWNRHGCAPAGSARPGTNRWAAAHGWAPVRGAVLCFVPSPATTQGEARAVRRLAAEYHWTKVTVVTSAYHVTRARLLLGRCFAGTLDMMAPPTTDGPARLTYQTVYQSAALVWAHLRSGC